MALLVGLTFLAPLKFGTPAALQGTLVPPADWFEWIFFLWPNQLAIIVACGGLVWMVLDRERLAARVDLLFVLPVLFLMTQLVAAPTSICAQTTADTLMHFAVAVLLFYAAAWYVRDGAAAGRVFGALGLASFLMLIIALEQHWGGLESTRDFAAVYAEGMPEDLRLRLTSDRVFGTLVNPNSLAGFLVIAFAPTLAWVWGRARGWDARVKWLTLVLVGGLMVLVLALTGSRGGFVAFAAMIMVGLFCIVPSGSRRTGWVAAALAGMVVVFIAAERAGVIHLGTTSVAARRDYWEGAVAIARDHPWLGTGPGTYGSIYPKYKVASSEEAQLAHNNFLQMWSDSGVAGFVVFALLWLVALRDGLALVRQRVGDAAAIAITAALAGWVVHGVVDFDLYVPGVAWPAFGLLGVLQGLKNLPDIQPVTAPSRRRWGLGLVCLVLVGIIVWWAGRSWVAQYHQGRSLLLSGAASAEALEEIQQAIRWNPNNPHLRQMAGDLAAEMGLFEEAVGYYQVATELDPYRASYHWRMARALRAAGGREREAVERLRRAVALNPTQSRYRADLVATEESIRQPQPSLLESSPLK
jgi:O-antigen ligase